MKRHKNINKKEYKSCYRCKQFKLLDCFFNYKRNLDNLEGRCKLCLKNSEIIQQSYKNWKQKNKKRIKEYEKNRIKNDINFKITKNLRTRLFKAMKGISKSANTLTLIGCNIPELKKHLEKQFQDGMTWDNYGKWHIDHIIPCCKFNLINEKEQRKCFNYKNLQPLWAFKNISKGGRIPQ